MHTLQYSAHITPNPISVSNRFIHDLVSVLKSLINAIEMFVSGSVYCSDRCTESFFGIGKLAPTQANACLVNANPNGPVTGVEFDMDVPGISVTMAPVTGSASTF